MPEIKEVDAEFFGREVIQIDGFFFVDSGMGVQGLDGWVSDQKMNYSYRGCLYTRQDQTSEAYEYFPRPKPPTAEELASYPRFDVADLRLATPEESAQLDCRHRARAA